MYNLHACQSIKQARIARDWQRGTWINAFQMVENIFNSAKDVPKYASFLEKYVSCLVYRTTIYSVYPCPHLKNPGYAPELFKLAVEHTQSLIKSRMATSIIYDQTCQVSRVSRESHALSLNSRFSARLNIISRILFYLSYALISQEN